MKSRKKIIVIGGGAAGFFAAINIAEKCDNAEITIAEKTQKLLSKVKVSGGGRCNVTNDCPDISKLVKNYPRGEKQLKKIFRHFAVEDTISWFEERGVELQSEDDGRMFPVTNSSQTIINCFSREAERLKIKINTGCEIKSITKKDAQFILDTNGEELTCDAVVVTTGGFSKLSAYEFLLPTKHKIIPPLPSLFTINLKKDPVTELMGVSVRNAEVKIAGTKLKYSGPVLITHWGFSGPAVLKLSAFAAETFHEKNYVADILINWTVLENEENVKHEIESNILKKPNSFPVNSNLFRLPERLWMFLLEKSEINPQKNWSEQTRKSLNKLINNLYADQYRMEGKTTFKEEFVTCGGIDLQEINTETMESKLVPGLYFAGEILNIDGITGGFNFQAAWSTAYVVSQSISGQCQEK